MQSNRTSHDPYPPSGQTVAADLVALVRRIDEAVDLPPVRGVYIPPAGVDVHRDAEFGLVTLEDDSAGFFYVWLADTQERLSRAVRTGRFAGVSVVDLALELGGADPARKALALGAVNAISQHLFRSSGYPLDTETDSMAGFAPMPADHVGLVGFFPSLVDRLRGEGVPVTVIEKKPELVQRSDRFEVTLDPSRLAGCNKIMCTAATLLNDTLDEVLGHCRHAEYVAIIGPTASCLPDPLFERGASVVGGAVVQELPTLMDRLRAGDRWGDSVSKYGIGATAYPGLATLLRSAAR